MKRENSILALHSVVSGLCPPLARHNCYQTPATLVRVNSSPLKQRYLLPLSFFLLQRHLYQMYWDENVDIWGQIDLSGSEYELSQIKAWYKKSLEIHHCVFHSHFRTKIGKRFTLLLTPHFRFWVVYKHCGWNNLVDKYDHVFSNKRQERYIFILLSLSNILK